MRYTVLTFAIISCALILFSCSYTPALCEKVSNPVDKEYCTLTYALEQNDSVACAGIGNENWRIWCYTDVANNLQDVKLCEKIQKESSRQHCIKNVALAIEEPELCSALQGTPAGDECFRILSLNDSSLCDLVSDITQRNTCYMDSALDQNDWETCKGIEFDQQKEGLCLFRIALRTNQTSVCYEILDEDMRDICFVNRAIHALDKEICGNIHDKGMNGSCKAAVNQAIEQAATGETPEEGVVMLPGAGNESLPADGQ